MKLVDNKNNKVPSLYLIFTFVFLMAITQACSSSKSAPPPPPPPTDQDAQGLYTKSGTSTATFNATDVALTDIKGMVYGALPNQKFIFFDVTSNILFDGEITAITLRNVTGTATVYKDGNVVNSAVTVTGTVDSRSNVNLTFTGAGVFTSATISGLFSSDYDTSASNARILSNIGQGGGSVVWKSYSSKSAIPNTALAQFSLSLDNSYTAASLVTGVTCNHQNGIADVSATVNIYIMSEDIQDGGGCSILVATNYTGFASVLDVANTKDTQWYAMTNGTYAHFAILTR